MYKVVFHIDQNEKWQILLGNVRNLLKQDSSGQIEIVVNGIAVTELLSINLLEELSLLEKQGVAVNVCANSLQANNVLSSDIPQSIEIVPVGVLKLIELQHSDYAYIRP